MSSQQIEISQIGRATLEIPVIGLSPLLVHKFSEKARKVMLDAMQGRKTPKEPKDPEKEFEASMYRMDDGGFGFPILGFKAATVSAARFYGSDVTMTGLRQSLFFQGEWSKVEGQSMARVEGDPHMREDVVRVARGGTDLRYRAEFPEWRTTLKVIYVKSLLTKESVVSLVDAGGLGVGVGDWRPERSGDFGQYGIDPTREIAVVG